MKTGKWQAIASYNFQDNNVEVLNDYIIKSSMINTCLFILIDKWIIDLSRNNNFLIKPNQNVITS